jgi:glycosyltransferase 2 family protein
VRSAPASAVGGTAAPALGPAWPAWQASQAWPAIRVSRAFWGWAQPLAGAGVLAFLLWRLGTGPFLRLRLVDGWALAAALGIGGLTTVCCAWRWRLVAGGLGVRLPLRTAIARCYLAVFLNATLPCGVLGDVHRAVCHGREAGHVGRGVRAVVWERTAGQVVFAGMAVIVLFAFPSPIRSHMAAVTAVAAAVALGAVLLARALPRNGLLARLSPRSGRSRCAQALRAAKADIGDGLLARRNWLRIAFASAVVVSGHLATFLIAARTAGTTAPLSRLIPLALLALLAMLVPVSIGGFGPREGVAAWAFSAAGLTAAQGVATAVVYGALVLAASLPGAAVLLAQRIRVPAAVRREGTGASRGRSFDCSS